MKQHNLLFTLLSIFFLVACASTPTVPAVTLPETTTPIRTPTSTSTLRIYCITPTPEPLWVEPVISSTEELTQRVIVHTGNNTKAITITGESGTFSIAPASARNDLEIPLLPNTTHHLRVYATIKTIFYADKCPSLGGYTLDTMVDGKGNSLIIHQGQPSPPRLASAIISPDNVLQLQQLGTISPYTRGVKDFVFNSDNEMVIVGYNNISLWSAITGQKIRQISDDGAEAVTVTINADQSLIATGGTANNRSVRLWNVSTGEMREFGHHTRSVAFNPNGTWLASGSSDNTIRIWDVDNGQSVITLEEDISSRLQSFRNLYWVDDNTLIAASSDAVYWWRVNTGQSLQRLTIPEQVNNFSNVTFSQNGNRLAGIAFDNAVYFWDGKTENWAVWPVPAGSTLKAVEFSPDGQLLVAGSSENEMLIWNVNTQELLASYSITGGTDVIRFSPDGRYIAVGGWHPLIQLWGIP